MARIRYGVAMSLDGFIAGPNGEADWIRPSPDFDFGALWAEFDTLLMGRITYDAARARLGEKSFEGKRTLVVSTSMTDAPPNIEVVRQVTRGWVDSLRASSRKDVWLFGGASLFASLLSVDGVDGIDVSVIAILLGEGIPLLPACGRRVQLELLRHSAYRSGMMRLEYSIGKR